MDDRVQHVVLQDSEPAGWWRMVGLSMRSKAERAKNSGAGRSRLTLDPCSTGFTHSFLPSKRPTRHGTAGYSRDGRHWYTPVRFPWEALFLRAQPSETRREDRPTGCRHPRLLVRSAQSLSRPRPRPHAPPLRPGNGGGALIDFEVQIRPLLSEHCLECHSQDKRKGGLSLATYADALEGGRNGAVIRPGNSARSLIIDRVTGAVEPQMPKDEPPLGAARAEAGARLDRSRRARRRPSPAGAAAVGSAARADPSRRAGSDWPTWSRTRRSIRRRLSADAAA